MIPKVVKKEQINLIYYDYIKALYSVHEYLREHMDKWFTSLYQNVREGISAREALEREKEKEEIETLLKPIT